MSATRAHKEDWALQPIVVNQSIKLGSETWFRKVSCDTTAFLALKLCQSCGVIQCNFYLVTFVQMPDHILLISDATKFG